MSNETDCPNRLTIQVNSFPIQPSITRYLPGNNRARLMAELMRVDHFRTTNLRDFSKLGFAIMLDGKPWNGRE